MKSPFNRIFAILLLLLFAFSMLLMFTSCGAKKQTKEAVKTETKIDIITSENTQAKSVEDVKIAEMHEAVSEDEFIDFQGKQGDTLKIIKTGVGGQILSQTIYTGNGKITSGKSKMKSLKQQNINRVKTDTTYSTLATKAVNIQKTDLKKSDVSRSSWFSYWGLYLILIGAVAFYIVRQKLNLK